MKVRRSLTLKEKLKIIQEVKMARKQVDIAHEMSIPASTVSTIVKSETKITSAMSTECFKAKRKRMRHSAYPEVEKALLVWITNARQQRISISGPLIKEKAEELSLRLNADGFSSTDGWLSRFKERHSLVFRTVSGEGATVDTDATEDWRESVLVPMLKNYLPKNVFNADETGLFFKMQPNKTITFKSDSCIGGKRSKERMTVMVCANMDGTERIPLLVVGRYKKPRCFKGITTFPVVYEANSNSWITQSIFEKWVKKLDRKFYKENRKVLLFLDNCSAHFEVEGLLSIKLVFLPANTTAVTQPMDQGVICQLKKVYRHKFLQKMLFCMENCITFDFNILKAIHMIAAAWKELQPICIANFFRHAGFVNTQDSSEESCDEDDSLNEVSEIVNQLREKGMPLPRDFPVLEYLNGDNCLPVCATLTDEEIVRQVMHGNQNDSESDDDTDIPKKPTKVEVSSAIDCLLRYYSMEDGCESELGMVSNLEAQFVKKSLKKQEQSKILNFFKPIGQFK